MLFTRRRRRRCCCCWWLILVVIKPNLLSQRFAAVVMRIRKPNATALIFASGKVVVTGTKTEEEALLASRKFGRIVQLLGYPVKFLDFKIQNMVASVDVRFPIQIERLIEHHQQFCRCVFSFFWVSNIWSTPSSPLTELVHVCHFTLKQIRIS